MANFVLVHGAWHGGWCYRDTARMLRAQGHTVITPTHTGVGERAQPWSVLLGSRRGLDADLSGMPRLG